MSGMQGTGNKMIIRRAMMVVGFILLMLLFVMALHYYTMGTVALTGTAILAIMTARVRVAMKGYQYRHSLGFRFLLLMTGTSCFYLIIPCKWLAETLYHYTNRLMTPVITFATIAILALLLFFWARSRYNYQCKEGHEKLSRPYIILMVLSIGILCAQMLGSISADI